MMNLRTFATALHEIFPQVEEPILKAVALEHRNDVDAAVQFILSEVIPNQEEQIADMEIHSEEVIPNQEEQIGQMGIHSEGVTVDGPITENCSYLTSDKLAPPSFPLHEIISTDRRSDFEGILADPNRTEHDSSLSDNFLTDQETDNIIESRSLHLPKQLCDEITIGDSSSTGQFNSTQSQIRIQNNCFSSHSDDMKEIKGDHLHCSEKSLLQIEDVNISVDKSSSNSKNAEVNLLTLSSKVTGMVDSEISIGQLPHRDTMNVSSCEEEKQFMEGTVVRATESQSNFSVIEGTVESLNAVESSGKESADRLPVQTIQDTICSSGFKKDNENVENDTGCSFISVENSSLSCSRTRQIVNIDTLEGLVSKAKEDEKELIEAMNLIRSLRAEAHREEVAAQRAKEEAANGGLDILSKVEEMRKMLASAREAYDTGAGEVYGERAVLALEAEELRSRLVQLSADKAKAFCMAEELRKDLKARINSAKNEKKAAEEEKMRKEETLMTKVVQDTKEFEQEEKANSKLREFLIDCGCMVDALNGGVSVVSEDVKLINDQIDGGITEIANGYLNINLGSPPRCQDMDGHLTSSNDNIFESSFSRTHGSIVDIILSKFSTRSESRDSEDAESLHSSLCQSIAKEEMDYLTTGAEMPVAEKDTECHGLTAHSSNCSVEAERQQYLKIGDDEDESQILDLFGEEFKGLVFPNYFSSS